MSGFDRSACQVDTVAHSRSRICVSEHVWVRRSPRGTNLNLGLNSRDALICHFWSPRLHSHSATASFGLLLFFFFLMQLRVHIYQCLMWRTPPIVTMRITQLMSHSLYDTVTYDKSRLVNVTLCCRGLNIPDALRQRPVLPVTRVRSIWNALKSVHWHGAIASYNKIVVCCNNFMFFFSCF